MNHGRRIGRGQGVLAVGNWVAFKYPFHAEQLKTQ